jgi:hypothetical protein
MSKFYRMLAAPAAGLIAAICVGALVVTLTGKESLGWLSGMPVLIVVVTLREILTALTDLLKEQGRDE